MKKTSLSTSRWRALETTTIDQNAAVEPNPNKYVNTVPTPKDHCGRGEKMVKSWRNWRSTGRLYFLDMVGKLQPSSLLDRLNIRWKRTTPRHAPGTEREKRRRSQPWTQNCRLLRNAESRNSFPRENHINWSSNTILENRNIQVTLYRLSRMHLFI